MKVVAVSLCFPTYKSAKKTAEGNGIRAAFKPETNPEIATRTFDHVNWRITKKRLHQGIANSSGTTRVLNAFSHLEVQCPLMGIPSSAHQCSLCILSEHGLRRPWITHKSLRETKWWRVDDPLIFWPIQFLTIGRFDRSLLWLLFVVSIAEWSSQSIDIEFIKSESRSFSIVHVSQFLLFKGARERTHFLWVPIDDQKWQKTLNECFSATTVNLTG
jgi:hypothetical protein